MKKPTKNKIFNGILKWGGVGVSAAFPLWAVIEKFPLWVETHGVGRSIGTGGIIGGIIALVIFRDAIVAYFKEKFKNIHTPKITWWIVALIITYVLLYICKFLSDLSLILWMGLLGSVIGTLMTVAGDTIFGEEEKNE